MIRNDNKIGNYWVLVYANRNSVASFECPTLDDAAIEVARIVAARRTRNLPTTKATARQIIGRKPTRGSVLAAPITIDTTGASGNTRAESDLLSVLEFTDMPAEDVADIIRQAFGSHRIEITGRLELRFAQEGSDKEPSAAR